MATNINLKTMSVVELKSIAYDLQMLFAQTQQNLKIVSQELQSRQPEPEYAAAPTSTASTGETTEKTIAAS
jgi:hypothetical protein